jgi:hypothetical protein
MANYIDVEPRLQDAEGIVGQTIRHEEETSAMAGSSLKNQASETAGRAKDQAKGIGRRVQGKIEQSRKPAANRLEDAASALPARAEKLPRGDTVARWAHGTADKMQATANYVRGHDMGDMVADVKTFTRKHPGGRRF